MQLFLNYQSLQALKLFIYWPYYSFDVWLLWVFRPVKRGLRDLLKGAFNGNIGGYGLSLAEIEIGKWLLNDTAWPQISTTSLGHLSNAAW